MDLKKLNSWLQFLASVGVVFGLVLVAYELRQNQEITRAQLNSDSLAAMEDLQRSRQQEPLAIAIAKTHNAPKELTAAEQVLLDGYFKEAFLPLVRETTFIMRGIYADVLERNILIFAYDVLATAYGQLWWERFRTMYPVEFAARIDAVFGQMVGAGLIKVDEQQLQELRDHYGF